MIKTDVSSLDRTVHKTNQWLQDLTDIGGYDGPQQAYTALHAVLHTLRDTLDIHEAAQLAAGMPMLLRGVFFEGWSPSQTLLRLRSRDDFLDAIRERMGNADIDPEHAARSVFRLLEERIDDGEVQDVRNALHRKVRELWSDGEPLM
jgi:uncharacterized protein (DUF2267 family)